MRLVFTLGTAGKSGGTEVILTLIKFCEELGHQVVIHCLDSNNSSFWYCHYPQLTQITEQDIKSTDVLVISEEFIYCAATLSHRTTKYIILNQGIGSSLASDFKRNTYTATKLIYQGALGVITNSDHTKRGVAHIFEVDHNKLFRLPLPVNDKFAPKQKEKIITYMPRKNRKFGAFVVNYLCGKYLDYEFVPIVNMNQDQVSDLLGRSMFFLSFGGPEGLGLPPLEAAMSECIVIGHDGFGGAEYFERPIFNHAQFYDHIGFVNEASVIIEQGYHWGEFEQLQLDHIKMHYNMDNARKSFYNIMNCILGEQNV